MSTAGMRTARSPKRLGSSAPPGTSRSPRSCTASCSAARCRAGRARSARAERAQRRRSCARAAPVHTLRTLLQVLRPLLRAVCPHVHAARARGEQRACGPCPCEGEVFSRLALPATTGASSGGWHQNARTTLRTQSTQLEQAAVTEALSAELGRAVAVPLPAWERRTRDRW